MLDDIMNDLQDNWPSLTADQLYDIREAMIDYAAAALCTSTVSEEVLDYFEAEND